jgi:E3 ubiquitin-protein ligase DOA10
VYSHISTQAHARAAQHANGSAASSNARQAHRALHAQKKSFRSINRVDRPVWLASAWSITINHAQSRSAIAPAEHAANGIHYQSLNVGAPAAGQHISVLFA